MKIKIDGMNEETELKPCPFCGSNNLEIRHSIAVGEALYIVCRDCGVAMIGEKTAERYEDAGNGFYRKIAPKTAEEVVVEKWNRRAYEDRTANV